PPYGCLLAVTTAKAPAVTSWTVAQRKAAWLATITKSRWTLNGRRFPTTGSTIVVAPDGGAHVCAPRQEGSGWKLSCERRRNRHLRTTLGSSPSRWRT